MCQSGPQDSDVSVDSYLHFLPRWDASRLVHTKERAGTFSITLPLIRVGFTGGVMEGECSVTKTKNKKKCGKIIKTKLFALQGYFFPVSIGSSTSVTAERYQER